jgi:hypothetical protein
MDIAEPQFAFLLINPFADSDQQAQDGGRQKFHVTKIQHQVDAGRLLHNRFHRLPQGADVGVLENSFIRESDNVASSVYSTRSALNRSKILTR